MIWIAGFLTAVVWSMLNFFLTSRILRAAVMQKSKFKVLVIMLVKFPLLYLLGYFILVSRRFPLSSLLCGLLPGLIVLGARKLWPKRT